MSRFLSKLHKSSTNEFNNQMDILKLNEQKIDEYEANNRMILGLPEVNIQPHDLYAPDLTVSGIHHKIFKAIGRETIIPIISFIKNPSFMDSRKYMRLAYLRIVWIPNAANIPGEVNLALADFRARKGLEVISSNNDLACNMHRHTYYQDFYIHKKEMKYFNIIVNLKGFETKYKNNMFLGSVRIYWITQWSNNPTQYETVEIQSAIIPKTKMPIIKSLEANSLIEFGNSQHAADNLMIDGRKSHGKATLVEETSTETNQSDECEHCPISTETMNRLSNACSSLNLNDKHKNILHCEDRIQLSKDDEARIFILNNKQLLLSILSDNNSTGASTSESNSHTIIEGQNHESGKTNDVPSIETIKAMMAEKFQRQSSSNHDTA